MSDNDEVYETIVNPETDPANKENDPLTESRKIKVL